MSVTVILLLIVGELFKPTLILLFLKLILLAFLSIIAIVECVHFFVDWKERVIGNTRITFVLCN